MPDANLSNQTQKATNNRVNGDQSSVFNSEGIGTVIINNLSQKWLWLPILLIVVIVALWLWIEQQKLIPPSTREMQATLSSKDTTSETGDKSSKWIDTLGLDTTSTALIAKDTIIIDTIIIWQQYELKLPNSSVTTTKVLLEDLEDGQVIKLQFEGRAYFGPITGYLDPDGIPKEEQLLIHIWHSLQQFVPFGAVMYRWGSEMPWDVVGSQQEIRAPNTGNLMLHFFVNDRSIEDNQGSFDGIISYPKDTVVEKDTILFF